MPVEGGSRTALWVAAYRGRSTQRNPPVCVDPWAAQLAGDEGRELALRYDKIFVHGELWIAVRTATIDRCLASLVGPSCDQVVLLGAGLDSRAVRMAANGIRFFEVDHPTSQQDKLRRVQALEGYPAEAATYVPCDFETDDFIERLEASGFDSGRPAAIVWEGVAYYLTEDAIRSTLAKVAERLHPESTIIFDLVGKRLVAARSSYARDQDLLAMLNDLSEPFRTGIDDPVPLLFESGYRYIDTVRFDEACLQLTGTYLRDRAFRFQQVVTASRGNARVGT